ncbi:MAG TPA: glycine cleavage system aminomethyltransferase GcvT [Candidatus Limnocylindria bacterium]|nr:glycine cleavage system aminomethyltransferase GcvT [Candidatus Limnocylindria bacterium]
MTEATAPDTLRRTPLHDLHLELGARMVPFAGYEMPVQYESIIEEHRTVRNAVGVFDLSHMGELDVRGEDAVAFLRNAVVSDPGAMSIGQAQYSMLCDDGGGIIDDLIIYRRDEQRFMVVCNASNRFAVIEQLMTLLEDGDLTAEVEDRSDATGLVAPQGPRAAAVLARLTDLDVDQIANYHFAEGDVAGIACTVARTGYTGEDGFELFCDASHTRELWEAVAAAGAGDGIRPCGLGARDTLRLEAGMPLYGNELGRDTNPFEVNLGRVVKLDKGDFVGRQALQAVADAGARRKLIGLQMIDNAIPRAGYEVLADGDAVGRVTSGTLSPTLGTKIAMALVPADRAGIGNEFEVVVRERPQRAEQVKLPFYRRPRD